jgi:hypothetical protein
MSLSRSIEKSQCIILAVLRDLESEFGERDFGERWFSVQDVLERAWTDHVKPAYEEEIEAEQKAVAAERAAVIAGGVDLMELIHKIDFIDQAMQTAHSAAINAYHLINPPQTLAMLYKRGLIARRVFHNPYDHPGVAVRQTALGRQIPLPVG